MISIAIRAKGEGFFCLLWLSKLREKLLSLLFNYKTKTLNSFSKGFNSSNNLSSNS